MVFYKNGIHLEGFPMFYYGSHDALALIADILDGYFPRQLEKSYPDGVLLHMVDKLDEVHDEKKPTKIGSINDTPLGDGMKQVSKEDFLNKLPEKVIRDGKIIEIRKAVEERLKGPGAANSSPATKTQPGLKGVVKNDNGDWVLQNECVLDPIYKDSPELCVLKVRLDFLGESLIAYFPKDTLLPMVLGQLTKCMPDRSKRYKLVNGFPRTDFDMESNLSLEELGLFPRAAIFMAETN